MKSKSESSNKIKWSCGYGGRGALRSSGQVVLEKCLEEDKKMSNERRSFILE